MRIEIDTKEDLHNIRHVIQFLSAIQSSPGKHKSFTDDSSSSSSFSMGSMFNEQPAQQTPPATSASMFNMFADPSPSPAPSSTDGGYSSLNSLFNQPEVKKEDDNSKDFLDSMQVY